jgi:hypothetical protein
VLAVWPLVVLFLEGRESTHAAMVPLTTQPANKRTHQTSSIETIRRRSPMLAGDRNAGWVNHVSFNLVAAEPARQPEAVAHGEPLEICETPKAARTDH